MGGVSEDVLLARAYLSRVAEPASLPVWALVRRAGPVDAARAIRAGIAGDKVLEATAARAAAADPGSDLEVAQRHGIRLVVPESEEWPHFGLAALEHSGAQRLAMLGKPDFRTRRESGEPIPPLALWAKGDADLASLAVRSAAIVGSRAATAYGERVAGDLAFGLAQLGLGVVSGGAYGIDAAAHRGALAAGGVTVLISAGGLDRPYPSGNAQLFGRVAESGLLLSESPPGAAPQRQRFLSRNRLIAALATGTVVVEAARRSGALNTANHCLELGRPVMAVPGPVSSPMSGGCHDLLRREGCGVRLVTSVDEVLEVVGRPGEGALGGGGAVAERDDTAAVLDELDATARRVFDGLPARRASGIEEISLASGVAAREVLRVLPVLELSGLVEAVAEGYRIRRSRSPTRVAP
jgi:DNA processing protein